VSVEVKEDGTLSYTLWVKRGNMIINRDALDFDDPDHLYNRIAELGLDPEAYGVSHPISEQYKDHTRSQLIKLIIDLKREVESLHKHLA